MISYKIILSNEIKKVLEDEICADHDKDSVEVIKLNCITKSDFVVSLQ